MATLTADHIIGNLGLFHQVLKAAYQAAGENYLVTLGITPTYPATGYGYTRRGALIGKFQEMDVFHVQEFTEKPQLEEAERMVASGQYAWNSGMFIWKTDQILKEIKEQMPDLASQLEMIGRAWDTEEQDKVIRAIWPDIQPQTIDFGIMEGASRVAVVPAGDLGWSDVGSWEALYDLLTADELGNIFREIDHLALDTRGTILYGMDQSRMVVTIGVEDLIIIDTDDVLLVCTRDQAQEVRQAVRELERLERTDLL
jgi:mannose-1-phosphate guanylyltransferase